MILWGQICVYMCCYSVCVGWLKTKVQYLYRYRFFNGVDVVLCCVCYIYSPVIRLSKSYVFFGMCTADIIYKEERERNQNIM